MADRFLVLGAGGHGRVVAEAIQIAGHRVIGFADVDPAAVGRVVLGLPVLAAQEEVLRGLGAGERPVDFDAVALGIGANAARLALAERLVARAGPALLKPVVHPAAFVSPSATLGPGCVVLPGAVVHTAARIGIAAIVNSGAVVEHDCVIGAGVHLSPRAAVCGTVSIGDLTWVGAGATVIHGRTIGRNCLIGAGAVVLGDLPADCRAVGVPARARAHGSAGEDRTS